MRSTCGGSARDPGMFLIMKKPTPDAILSTTTKVARTVRVGERFWAVHVQKQLGLPREEWHGEAIRECWRQNRGWLHTQGLKLIEERKKVKSRWFLLKEKA